MWNISNFTFKCQNIFFSVQREQEIKMVLFQVYIQDAQIEDLITFYC